jgi:ferredoxin-thioredoxin reductase catalytic subunit
MAEKKGFLETSRQYAEENGFALNPDEKILGLVIAALEKNIREKGKPYCPCRPLVGNREEDDKKVCPCAWHLAEIEQDGHCKCRLFFSREAAQKSR